MEAPSSSVHIALFAEGMPPVAPMTSGTNTTPSSYIALHSADVEGASKDRLSARPPPRPPLLPILSTDQGRNICTMVS